LDIIKNITLSIINKNEKKYPEVKRLLMQVNQKNIYYNKKE
jgi:hypothetical protein